LRAWRPRCRPRPPISTGLAVQDVSAVARRRGLRRRPPTVACTWTVEPALDALNDVTRRRRRGVHLQ
jgi:hypothetical protein